MASGQTEGYILHPLHLATQYQARGSRPGVMSKCFIAAT